MIIYIVFCSGENSLVTQRHLYIDIQDVCCYMRQAIIFLLCVIVLSSAAAALLTPITKQVVIPNMTVPIIVQPIVNDTEDDGLAVDYAQGTSDDDASLGIVQPVNRTTTEYDTKGRVGGYDEQEISKPSPVVEEVKPVIYEGVRCSADDCTYHYDKDGVVIGVTEKSASDDAPNKTRTITRIIVYDKMGRIDREIDVSPDSFIKTDDLADVGSMGDNYQVMLELMKQTNNDRKERLEEMRQGAEAKLNAALEEIETKEQEIEKYKQKAESNFAEKAWLSIRSLFVREKPQGYHQDIVKCRQVHETQRRAANDCEGILEMKDAGRTLYYDPDGRLLGYRDNQSMSIFMYDALGNITDETVIDERTGNVTNSEALKDALGEIDIESLTEIVMFEAWQAEEDGLQQAIDELHKTNEQKARMRQAMAEMKKQKAWLEENESALASKLPETIENYTGKGAEIGEGAEKPGFMMRFWDLLSRPFQSRNDTKEPALASSK